MKRESGRPAIRDLKADDVISPELHGLLYHASLAPSGHNAQPWTVRVDDRGLWVGTDATRWLPKVDPANRELMLSIGAFLENLITAAGAHGFAVDCEIVATQPTSDVARLTVKPATPRDVGLERLRVRRTIRTGHLGREISSADLKALETAAGGRDLHFFGQGSPGG